MMLLERLYKLITRLADFLLPVLAVSAVGLCIFFGFFAILAAARLMLLVLIVGAVLLVMFMILKTISD